MVYYYYLKYEAHQRQPVSDHPRSQCFYIWVLSTGSEQTALHPSLPIGNSEENMMFNTQIYTSSVQHLLLPFLQLEVVVGVDPLHQFEQLTDPLFLPDSGLHHAHQE